jgi:hypothetical protein
MLPGTGSRRACTVTDHRARWPWRGRKTLCSPSEGLWTLRLAGARSLPRRESGRRRRLRPEARGGYVKWALPRGGRRGGRHQGQKHALGYDVQGSALRSRRGGHHTSNVAGVCRGLLRRGAEIVGDIAGRLAIGCPQGKPEQYPCGKGSHVRQQAFKAMRSGPQEARSAKPRRHGCQSSGAIS